MDQIIPIYGVESQSPPLLSHISSKLNVCPENIVSYDLHFIDSDPSSMIFNQNDYIIHSQRLNGLHNTYTVLKAFINSTPEEGTISMIAIFDNNEDAESKASSSAESNVIDSTFHRILILVIIVVLKQTHFLLIANLSLLRIKILLLLIFFAKTILEMEFLCKEALR